jgi:hypothetical protein
MNQVFENDILPAVSQFSRIAGLPERQSGASTAPTASSYSTMAQIIECNFPALAWRPQNFREKLAWISHQH